MKNYILPIIFVVMWAAIILLGDWTFKFESAPLSRYCATVEVMYPIGQGLRMGFCMEGNDRPEVPILREEV